jgi:hypothetical protein
VVDLTDRIADQSKLLKNRFEYLNSDNLSINFDVSSRFPLINISLFEFTRRVFLAGGISLKGIFLILLYYLRIIPSLPLEFLQFLVYGQQIDRTVISKDPVFILGHYRSGTTYLQKLMVSDHQFGFLTNYDSLFPNSNLLFGTRMQHLFQGIINFFKIKNPFFHQRIVLLSEPDEEDNYLMNKGSVYSAYWGLIFPKCWLEWLNGSSQFLNQEYCNGWKKEYLKTIKYATFKSKGKQLVLKSPPNTERIRLLLQLFPQAKFIYICRNPCHLYYSTKNMWERAILKNYSLQQISDIELDKIIFEHFIYLTEQYQKEKVLIPNGNLVEITYEELRADSFRTIQKVYTELGLPDFELATKDLLHQLEMEKDYRTFEHQFCDSTFKRIEERWGKQIHQWNQLRT